MEKLNKTMTSFIDGDVLLKLSEKESTAYRNSIEAVCGHVNVIVLQRLASVAARKELRSRNLLPHGGGRESNC